MENYQKLLLSKNGLATLSLSREFLQYDIGERIPTVSELSERLDLARGTTQNSIKFLQKNNAISLESRGHLGTFLRCKSTDILLEFAGITSLVGAMPLPYSKRYEGFATGIIEATKNNYNLPVTMAYMRGANNRINMLLDDRCDFAVVSRYTAEEYKKNKQKIHIAKSFGPHSYLSAHVIIFHNKAKIKIEDGMRVGIDRESIDQMNLTELVCKEKNVYLIQVEYSQMLNHVLEGSIDAAVWNKDEITDKMIDIQQQTINIENSSISEAVIITNANNPEIKLILNEIIDVETVLDIQKKVLSKQLTPSY